MQIARQPKPKQRAYHAERNCKAPTNYLSNATAGPSCQSPTNHSSNATAGPNGQSPMKPRSNATAKPNSHAPAEHSCERIL